MVREGEGSHIAGGGRDLYVWHSLWEARGKGRLGKAADSCKYCGEGKETSEILCPSKVDYLCEGGEGC